MQTRRRLKSGSESENFLISVEEEKTKEKSIPTWAKIANKISNISDTLNPYSYILNPNHFQPANIYSDPATGNSNLVENSKNFYRGNSQNQFIEEPLIPEEEPIFVMASRDRTQDFASAARSVKERPVNIAMNFKDPRKARQFQNYSEFMMVAKHIGKNIASTFAKLEKLTLCKFQQ